MQKMALDHLDRQFEYSFPPKRIISLCPSITETLYALGLSEQVVGRTRYCIHPDPAVQQVTAVGGTKQVKREVIDQLKPDLIIAEKEENPKEMVEGLAADYPVFVANVENYADALRMIESLGEITGTEEQAKQVIQTIVQGFQQLEPSPGIRVAYLIWKNPYMAAGNSTYIHAMLEACGFENVFKARSERYPVIKQEELKKEAPDYVFLSTEPYPFQEDHLDEWKQDYPDAKPLLVDGEMFSWYGVRMLKAASYFKQLIEQIKNVDGMNR